MEANRFRFRAWSPSRRKMYAHDEMFCDCDSEYCLYDDGQIRQVRGPAGESWTESTDFILMQSTGLLDKNGKEIFEGDIVRYRVIRGDDTTRTETRDVKWVDGEVWPRPHKHECEDSWYDYEQTDFEVIGNIFERPELLKR